MKKYIFIYATIALFVYYFLSKYLKRKKYMKPFLEMGFSEMYLNRFSTDELFTSWNYLENYSLKKIQLTPEIDPLLYAKVKAVNDKFKIFSNIK
jgi:hypothetical protein